MKNAALDKSLAFIMKIVQEFFGLSGHLQIICTFTFVSAIEDLLNFIFRSIFQLVQNLKG